jgi:hypothetical protein
MYRTAAAAVAGLAMLAVAGQAPASAAIITQEYFEIQYDYGEFYANADNKEFRVEIAGNPFARPAAGGQESFERSLLAVMQAHKPQPRLRFVTQNSAGPQRPDYRFALLFNPTTAGATYRTCAGLDKPEGNMTQPTPGRVVIEVAYCRNEQTLSTLKATFNADSVNDPRFGQAFDEIFSALVPKYNPIRGEQPFRRFK